MIRNWLSERQVNNLLILVLVLATFSVFFSSLHNDFVNFDDTESVVDNMWLRDASLGNIHRILTSRLNWKYQPVTYLSYFAEYQLFQLNPWIYHFNNLLLHIANTLFSFFLVQILFKNRVLSFCTALLFGIHPLHVEPVVWITSRKDVLFTFFYLLSLCVYIHSRRINDTGRRYYYLSLFLFIFSLLSKEMAITLPLVLLYIDCYVFKKTDKYVLIQKIPFFLVSLIFGILTVIAAKTAAAFPASVLYGFNDRIIFSIVSVLIYIKKLFTPGILSCIHPLVGYYDNILKLALPLCCAIAVFLWVFRRNKAVLFGAWFFILTIWPAMHLIEVNDTIINERYVYLPLLGLQIALSSVFLSLLSRYPAAVKGVLVALGLLFVLNLGTISHQYTRVWKNSETLWLDVISKYPTSKVAHHNLGSYYSSNNSIPKALHHYNEAVHLDPCFHQAHYNIGNVYASVELYNAALLAFSKAIHCHPQYAGAYNNRARVYLMLGERNKAMADLDMAIDIDPKAIVTYFNRASIYLAERNAFAVLHNYEKILELPPRDPIEQKKKIEVEKKIKSIYKQIQNR